MSVLSDLIAAVQLIDYQAAKTVMPHHWNDLDWAMQQIRQTGKPAGDIAEYNELASQILTAAVPSMSAIDAGTHIEHTRKLTHSLELEYTAELQGMGYDAVDATYTARHAAALAMPLNEYLSQYGKSYMIKHNINGLGHLFRNRA